MANEITTGDSIKDVVRSSMKVPEFDKHMKKPGGHIGRNVVEIIRIKTIVWKPLMIKIINLRLRNLGSHLFSLYFNCQFTQLLFCLLPFSLVYHSHINSLGARAVMFIRVENKLGDTSSKSGRSSLAFHIALINILKKGIRPIILLLAMVKKFRIVDT